jgi:nicotinate-nucleotide adenylyltransferase
MVVAAAPALRVGLFGGAFDPPHLAHRTLVQMAMAQLQLDVVHVLPTGHAWHKQREVSPAPQRLAMAQLAFADLPGVQVDGRELLRTGPTYTVDTLHELRREYPGAVLHLLIGADQAAAFQTWHDWQAIVRDAIICIAQRAHATGASARFDASSLPGARVELLSMPAMDTSATAIRSRVAAHLGIDHLVPAAVARYIDQHHLYRIA